MKKRGQITVFFIVGIIILLIVGLYFGIRAIWFKTEGESQFQISGEIPEKIKPVNDYLQSCLNNKLADGVDIISVQGGYINIPTDSMPTSAFTPVGRSLDIVQNSDLQTSVWFREKGNSLQEINIPTKTSMEKELETYVSDRFIECIEGTMNFANDGFIFSSTATKVDADILIFDQTVSAQVKFPIKVTKDNLNFTLDGYVTTVKNPLGRLYDVAYNIMKSENEEYFFENKTINTLVAYDPEIPFASLDTFCGDKTWSKSEVIAKLKDAIQMNTASLKVVGTDYTLPSDFKIMEMEMLDSNEDDLTINLMYSKMWPTFIEIQPSKGDLLTSESFSSGKGGQYTQALTQFMCLNSYQFIYTVKYPVMVSITDTNGDSFRFATEVIINNNQPRMDRLQAKQLDDTSSVVCNFPTANLTVNSYSYDNYGNAISLNNVNVEFKCTPSVCPVGNTLNDSTAILKVPPCYNGVIIGTKDGYFEGRDMQTIKSDQEYNSDLYLDPIYKKNVKLKIIDKFSGEIRDPYDSEEALVEFKNINNNYNSEYTFPDQSKVELIAGDYNVKVTLFRNSTWPITTQTKTVTHCISTPDASILGALGLSKTTNCQDISIPSMSFDQIQTGGEEFNYTFERQYLSDKSLLILYVMADSIPSTMEDVANIQSKVSVNAENSMFRYPEYE